MLKNNLKSLVINIPLIIATLLLKNAHFGRTHSHGFSLGWMALPISAVNIAIYVLFGYFALEDKGNFKKNFASVSSVILVGLVIWLNCFLNTNYGSFSRSHGDEGFRYEWFLFHDLTWSFYDIYTALFSLLTFPLRVVSNIMCYISGSVLLREFVNLSFLFCPCLVLCFGIRLKSKKA
jgi:hypothetical protein